MLTKIRSIFSKPSLPDPIHDGVLGTITFNTDENAWEAQVGHDDRGFVVRIAGTNAPDEQSLAHAREVASDPTSFIKAVQALLRREAPKYRPAEAEVLSLEVESLNFFWPKRPGDGMVYFEGGSKGRVWRCDYINKCPVGLGFDS